jgi:hypothetical protein
MHQNGAGSPVTLAFRRFTLVDYAAVRLIIAPRTITKSHAIALRRNPTPRFKRS